MDDIYEEKMPHSICECCARRLKAAHVFIQQTLEVNERLKALVGYVETDKELICLQEPALDMVDASDIKAEKTEDEEMDFLEQLEPECFVELKEDVKEYKTINSSNQKDILCIKKSKISAIEVLVL